MWKNCVACCVLCAGHAKTQGHCSVVTGRMYYDVNLKGLSISRVLNIDIGSRIYIRVVNNMCV